MAAAAVAACQVESVNELNSNDPETPVVPEVQKGTYTYTITASIKEDEQPAEVAVKSDYDASGHFSWSAGDAISVLFHKDDDNKFFTLTTTGTGASASFSGAIESGYTIGASDGDGSDKKIWALFPASSNHTYTAGALPTFYVQPSVDFSATHFSANLPMYAVNTAEGDLSFANLTCAYKFIVTGIKSGVSKVQMTVSNASGLRDLSGSSQIQDDGYGHVYVNYGWTSGKLTMVGNVSSNEAVFYVPCRFYADFKPTITVTNCATGVDIKTFTATTAKQPTDMSVVQPITLNVSEANGGNYYVPAVIVDGDFDDWDGVTEWDGTRNGGGSNSRINHWRMQADDLNIYVYIDLNSEKITNDRYIYVGFDTDSNTATGSAHGNCPGCEQYVVIYPAVSGSDPVGMIHGTDSRSTVNGSSDGTLTTWCNLSTPNSLLELCIPRSKVGLSSAASIKVSVSYDNYDAAQQTLVLP